ncbi:hypothetical protein ILS93_06535 [Bacillus sp. 16GRE42]|nr:hypothetical protein [Bacillus sp. 16GRE42]
MMEKEFEVRPFGVKYICDSCEEGEMVLTDDFKIYEKHMEFTHKCQKCGAERDFLEKYPLIRYQQV